MNRAGLDINIDIDIEQRARASLGISQAVIYRMVAAVLKRRGGTGGVMFDVGCGTGRFFDFAKELDASYCGVDVVRYDEFPDDARFIAADLDAPRWPIDDASADTIVSIETIEHLENPRAFFRELARITKAGGLIVATTPNQLSLLSKLTLLLTGQFSAFQAASYPAHRTALLKTDLLRIADETKLEDAQIDFSNHGRIPATAWHWPAVLGGEPFSDAVAISARKPRNLSGT